LEIIRTRKSTYLIAAVVGVILLAVSLFFALQKPVNIMVDGKTIHSRVFFTAQVADVLEEEQVLVGAKDRVEPSLNMAVKKNTDIVVTRAFKIKVVADGKQYPLYTTPVSIKEAIKLAGVSLSSKDIVKTLPVEKTVPGQEIEVIRVTESQVKEQAAIPFGVERTSDDTLERGLTRTLVQGVNGIAMNTVKIVYHNGQEVKRETMKSETVQQPRNRVVAMGTITEVSRGSQLINFREARYMGCSAYTYTGYHNATGQTPTVGTVAVDPAVIPLGSKLYIEGYGFATAADTGGSIRGDKLDLFMEERGQCLSWGRRTVKVYILN